MRNYIADRRDDLYCRNAMQQTSPIAIDLNATLEREAPAVMRLLCDRGQRIYFPSKGILGQTAEAKGKRYNATIGIGLKDDGSPLRLPSIEKLVNLPPKDVYPYAPSFGKQELREAWRAMEYVKNPGLKAEITMPVVTAGLTHGLSMAGYLFLGPGDTLHITSEHWDNCGLIYEETYGAELKSFPTFLGDGFDVEGMKRALLEGTPGKRAVLLNFPNNPSGFSPRRAEAAAIAAAIHEVAEAGNDVLVILDDAYFGFAYEEDVYPESLISLLGDLHERVLVLKIDGATKEDCVWGHRVGFITFAGKGLMEGARKALEQKAAGAVRATVSCACHVTQSMLLALYQSPTYAEEKRVARDVFAARYAEVRRVLANPKYAEHFTPLPFNSGYFFCVQLRDGMDADAVRRSLLERDAGFIALGPLLRIAFSSLPTVDIEPFFECLYEACSVC